MQITQPTYAYACAFLPPIGTFIQGMHLWAPRGRAKAAQSLRDRGREGDEGTTETHAGHAGARWGKRARRRETEESDGARFRGPSQSRVSCRTVPLSNSAPVPNPNPALSLSTTKPSAPREIGPADVIIASSILGELALQIGPSP